MKLNTINEYLQLGAAFGVIVGLALVVYEIRENTKISFQQEVSGNWSSWVELSMAEVESGISHELAKAMINAEELTLEEKIDLDSWLTAHVSIWMREYEAAFLTGERDVNDALEDIAQGAYFYFGNEFTRGWYLENKYWIGPEVTRVIDEKLQSTPLGSDIAYFERVSSHFIE
jgi:hypothetical protein